MGSDGELVEARAADPEPASGAVPRTECRRGLRPRYPGGRSTIPAIPRADHLRGGRRRYLAGLGDPADWRPTRSASRTDQFPTARKASCGPSGRSAVRDLPGLGHRRRRYRPDAVAIQWLHPTCTRQHDQHDGLSHYVIGRIRPVQYSMKSWSFPRRPTRRSVRPADCVPGNKFPSENCCTVCSCHRATMRPSPWPRHFGDRLVDGDSGGGQVTSNCYQRFVQAMNDQARQLGMDGTRFTNTHGLTEADHYTTAERPQPADVPGHAATTVRRLRPDATPRLPGRRTGPVTAATWCGITRTNCLNWRDTTE